MAESQGKVEGLKTGREGKVKEGAGGEGREAGRVGGGGRERGWGEGGRWGEGEERLAEGYLICHVQVMQGTATPCGC